MSKNRQEEKQVIEPLTLNWLRANEFDITVVDTKATWNPQAKRYLKRMASESLPDLIGNRGSLSVWIELKSTGMRSVINSAKKLHQRSFLVRKIRQGCFACVTDGVPHLRALWFKYENAKTSTEKMQVLLEDLPELRDFRQRTFADLPR